MPTLLLQECSQQHTMCLLLSTGSEAFSHLLMSLLLVKTAMRNLVDKADLWHRCCDCCCSTCNRWGCSLCCKKFRSKDTALLHIDRKHQLQLEQQRAQIMDGLDRQAYQAAHLANANAAAQAALQRTEEKEEPAAAAAGGSHQQQVSRSRSAALLWRARRQRRARHTWNWCEMYGVTGM
jgi:hypothetical protein